MLNSKADAYEAFDHLLEFLHAFKASEGKPDQTSFDAISSACQNCIVHQNFYQEQLMQRVCECGKTSEVEKMNRNLFAMVVNASDVIKTLDLIDSKDKSGLGKLKAMNGAFFDALNYDLSQSIKGCVDLSQSGGSSRLNTHKTKTVYSLLNSPEVFVLQLA